MMRTGLNDVQGDNGDRVMIIITGLYDDDMTK